MNNWRTYMKQVRWSKLISQYLENYSSAFTLRMIKSSSVSTSNQKKILDLLFDCNNCNAFSILHYWSPSHWTLEWTNVTCKYPIRKCMLNCLFNDNNSHGFPSYHHLRDIPKSNKMTFYFENEGQDEEEDKQEVCHSTWNFWIYIDELISEF